MWDAAIPTCIDAWKIFRGYQLQLHTDNSDSLHYSIWIGEVHIPRRGPREITENRRRQLCNLHAMCHWANMDYRKKHTEYINSLLTLKHYDYDTGTN